MGRSQKLNSRATLEPMGNAEADNFEGTANNQLSKNSHSGLSLTASFYGQSGICAQLAYCTGVDIHRAPASAAISGDATEGGYKDIHMYSLHNEQVIRARRPKDMHVSWEPS